MKFGILQIRRGIEMIVIEFFEWLGSFFITITLPQNKRNIIIFKAG
jgi:hypothetical protein